MSHSPKQMILAITGASGTIYALRLMARLKSSDVVLHILLSEAGRSVLGFESGLSLSRDPGVCADRLAERTGFPIDRMTVHRIDDWFSLVASGSSLIDCMIVVPCTMGTLARISMGSSENLIDRAADVMLKEGRRLILVPRETPVSSIHLEHMLKLARMGVCIMPAMPGFYHQPQHIDDLVDFMVDRMLDQLMLPDQQQRRWPDGHDGREREDKNAD